MASSSSSISVPQIVHANAPDRFATLRRSVNDAKLVPQACTVEADCVAVFAAANEKVGFTGIVDLTTHKIYLLPVVGDDRRGTVSLIRTEALAHNAFADSVHHNPPHNSGPHQLLDKLHLRAEDCLGFGLTKLKEAGQHSIEFQSRTCHHDKPFAQGAGRSNLGGPNQYLTKDLGSMIVQSLATALGARATDL